MVMATGIVAIALHLQGLRSLALALTVLNSGFFIVLALMTVARAFLYWSDFSRDLADHNIGLDFLTIVAGACVLGAQFILIAGNYRPAEALWILSLALWPTFTYAVFGVFIMQEKKPSLAEGINSGWLIAVVSTQALAQLTLLLLPEFGAFRRDAEFLALALWLAGGMLYIWIISLIFYRYAFFHLAPSELRPPYWIDMGAMAISTLVGTTLIRSGDEPFLAGLMPFIKGLTILFWATATWWIPMLIMLGLWRAFARHLRFEYNPLYWGAVFPLGVYAVATNELAQATGFRFLLWIPDAMAYVALAAWLAVFFGFMRAVALFHARSRTQA
jgi:tellurite resistance protein TehA-like permease